MKFHVQTIVTLIVLLQTGICGAQGRIAFTIDDVPNTMLFEQEGFQAPLLDQVDSLGMPVTIFINEGLLFKNEHQSANLQLLKKWAKSDSVELGNHTYSHGRYSEVGYQLFKEDVRKGEEITRDLATIYGKSLNQFRFPYNDLGADSAQQEAIHHYLAAHGYTSTPFTVESSDWIYNALYEEYLEANKLDSAEWIVDEYISYTMASLHFFDSVATKQYGRAIDHIYLCHDNKLNAKCLVRLKAEMEAAGFTFASLSEVMKDPVYAQQNHYYLKWGVTWIYRWMEVHSERIQLMHEEPEMEAVYLRFQQLKQ